MRALLAFLVVIASAAAQSIDPNQFILKNDLNSSDVNQLWRTLGISAKIRETTVKGSKDTSESFKCDPEDRCNAEFLWHYQSPLNSEYAVVRVSPRGGYYDLSRFLVFHSGDTSWQFVDYLDSTYSHYDTADALVVNSGGKRWFVVNSYPRCGTGCSLDGSEWFELKNGKFRRILFVPLSGHEGNENPGRYFETRFVRARRTQAGETLEFVFHVAFRPGWGSSIRISNLWEDEKIVRFSRPVSGGEFKFDPKTSEAPQAFVDDIFSTSEEVARPRIFQLIEDHLLEIARAPNDRRREWLKEVLKQNPTLPELARVRAAFAKAH